MPWDATTAWIRPVSQAVHLLRFSTFFLLHAKYAKSFSTPVAVCVSQRVCVFTYNDYCRYKCEKSCQIAGNKFRHSTMQKESCHSNIAATSSQLSARSFQSSLRSVPSNGGNWPKKLFVVLSTSFYYILWPLVFLLNCSSRPLPAAVATSLVLQSTQCFKKALD